MWLSPICLLFSISVFWDWPTLCYLPIKLLLSVSQSIFVVYCVRGVYVSFNTIFSLLVMLNIQPSDNSSWFEVHFPSETAFTLFYRALMLSHRKRVTKESSPNSIASERLNSMPHGWWEVPDMCHIRKGFDTSNSTLRLSVGILYLTRLYLYDVKYALLLYACNVIWAGERELLTLFTKPLEPKP